MTKIIRVVSALIVVTALIQEARAATAFTSQLAPNISTTAAVASPNPTGAIVFQRCINAAGTGFESCAGGSTNLTGPVTSVGAATTIVGPVPSAAVDLSTVTTALALKANIAGATFTGASGITNAAFTATGANGNIISGASITASGLFADGVYISTPVGSGNLRVRAGTGAGGGVPAITLFSWVGSSTTEGTGTGEMVGQTFDVPANTMLNNGDWLEVFCLAKATTTSIAKELVVRVFDDKDATGQSTNAARQWTNKSKVFRTSSTNVMHHAERERGDPGGAQGQSVDIDYVNTINFAASFNIDCMFNGGTVTTTNPGDEVMDLKAMSVILHTAP